MDIRPKGYFTGHEHMPDPVAGQKGKTLARKVSQNIRSRWRTKRGGKLHRLLFGQPVHRIKATSTDDTNAGFRQFL
jgi:hypothetical protein